MGKSSLAASIAEALGRRFADVSCNGMRQASDVRGDRRSWAGGQPGRLIRQLRSVGARNPVFVLDELDKIGEVAGVALLDALDPTRNAAFHDHYLEVPFDLSEVFFVATANVLGRIPTALRNRLEVIEIAGYLEADKLEIAKRILVPTRILDHGLTSGLIEFEDPALRTMISDHAHEMGLRALDRAVSAFCRRVALQLETPGDRTPAKVTVTETMVGEVLGARSGHGEGLPDVERIRAVIELGDLPPEARRQGKRELEVLLTNSPGDSDYNRSFAYLRWLAGLPWNARRDADRPAAHQEAARRAAQRARESEGTDSGVPGRAKPRRRRGNDTFERIAKNWCREPPTRVNRRNVVTMTWQSAHSAVRSAAVVLSAGGYFSAQWCASSTFRAHR